MNICTTKDINGNWIYANTEYDYLGRKLKDSEPYLSTTSPTLWTNYEYDDYNRPIKTTAPTGKIVTTIAEPNWTFSTRHLRHKAPAEWRIL